MNISIRTLTCVAALTAFVPAFAQEEEEIEESAETEETASGEEAEAQADGEKAPKHISELDERIFFVLPSCNRLEGRAEVRQPGKAEWEAVEENKFFPLGSTFRTTTEDTRFELAFGREVKVIVNGLASFSTRPQGLDVKSRAIVLDSGVIEVKLPLNFPEKMFSVTAPGFSAENLAGDSRFTYRKTGDGDVAFVRCVSGTLAVKGRHFDIPTMRAANELEIRTSQDVLFTGLFGKSGDYMCHFDTGVMQEMDWDLQKNVIVKKTLDWKISPKTAARIYRKVPEVGKNLAVSILTFDSNGELRNRWSFTEGRHEVNTGDQGPATKADRQRAAKALEDAAAAVETSAAEDEGETSSEEEASEEE